MAFTGSFLQKELVLRPRRKLFYARRCALIALGGLILLGCLLWGMASQNTTVGLKIFISLSYLLLFLFCLVTPVAAAQSIFMEKRARTLGLLYLTDMTNSRIVFGKFVSMFLFMTLTMLSVIPLFILSLTLGGLGPNQVAAGLALLLGTIYLGVGIGLYLGTVAKSEKSMFNMVVGWSAMVFLFLPMLINFLESLQLIPLAWIPYCASAWVSLAAVNQATQYFSFAYTNCGFSLVLGSVFVLLSWFRLPAQVNTALDDQRSGGLRQWFRRRREDGASPLAISGNPVAWKDLHFMYGGPKHEFMLCLGVSGITAVIAFIVCMVSGMDGHETAFGIFASMSACSLLAASILSLIRACRAFNTEKQNGALEVLLTSGLTTRDIVMGKFLAVARSVLPWLIGAVLFGLPLMPMTGEWGTGLTVFFYVLGYSTAMLVAVATALSLSLHFNVALTFFLSIISYFLWTSCLRSLALLPVTIAVSILGIGFFDMNEGEFGLALFTAGRMIPAMLLDACVAIVILRLMTAGFRISAVKKLR